MATKLICGAAAVALLMLCPAAPVFADDTGVATALHDARRERGKLCLSSHFHDGYSSGQRSKKQAERVAITAWAEFTAFEYGTDWARWSRAASRGLSCSKDAAGSWGCHAQARPCRR